MKRTSILGKRFYEIENDGRKVVFPSVTSIISHTSDKTWLYEWRKKVGEQKANEISRKSAGRGSIMHLLLELYTQTSGEKVDRLNKTFELAKSNTEYNDAQKEHHKIGRGLFYNFYNAGFLDDIKETHLNEQYLYQIVKDFKTIPIGYSGTIDNSHWTFGGKYKTIDFKTSRRPKKEDQIQNYKEQLAAYTIAVGKRYGIAADQAEIWISNEQENLPQRFIMDQKEIIHHYKIFTNRVYRFYTDFKDEIVDHYKTHLSN